MWRATLVHTRSYRPRRNTEFAIQAGPRLVVKGKALKLKAQYARRTALGIERGGRHVLLVVVQEAIKTETLAALMLKLGCHQALNLDGGSSTQLWSPLAGVPQLRGISVANAVLVLKR